MTTPSPSILAEAERLVPDWPMGHERVRHYVELTRPAVAAALQAKQDEIDRLRADLVIADRWIVGHYQREFWGGDWACKQCHPSSEMLKDGFVCAVHRAIDRALNPTPASTGAKHDGGVK